MTNPDKPFPRQLAETAIAFCCFASTNDMEPSIRKEFNEFAAKPFTTPEAFDFMARISKIQCDRTEIQGRRVCVGYISGFVQSLCDVERYYLRPDDDTPTSIPQEAMNRWRR